MDAVSLIPSVFQQCQVTISIELRISRLFNVTVKYSDVMVECIQAVDDTQQDRNRPCHV